jgi:glycosyltransferase involved in cell wall biosynthesis
MAPVAEAPQRVDQFHPSLSFGDAIGNQILSLQRLLRELGYQSEIYCEHPPDHFEGRARTLAEYPRETLPSAVLLAHFSQCYSPAVMDWLAQAPARKVLVYHNITPHRYFEALDIAQYESARLGREQLDILRPLMDAGWGDSAYNVDELAAGGWARLGVLPIVFDPRRYAVRPNRRVLRRYGEGLNVLFVGRIAPHKRQDDLIRVYCHLKRTVRSDSRLLLVGSSGGAKPYLASLRAYVARLELPDVVFAGHVDAAEWIAYYQCASVYLSMSEHEGFGVPLLESMHFGVPILAYKRAAVPETLGGAGLLLTERNHAAAAELIALLYEDRALRERVVVRQRERLQAFYPDRIRERLALLLQGLV